MNPHQREPLNINLGKVILYILTLAALGYLIAELVRHFDSFYPFFKEFFLYIESPVRPASGITSAEIVWCSISGVVLLIGVICYLVNMAELGLLPISLPAVIYAAVSGFLLFGVYYGALTLHEITEADPLPVGILIAMGVGAAAFLGLFVYLIVTRTFRAIPLIPIYLFIGLAAAVLILLAIRAVLYAIALAVIAAVMLSFNTKKRIVDRDGTVYEEV